MNNCYAWGCIAEKHVCKIIPEYYKKGYHDAIDDVEKAMKLAEVVESQPTFSGEITLNKYNDPAKFTEHLSKMHKIRFFEEETL